MKQQLCGIGVFFALLLVACGPNEAQLAQNKPTIGQGPHIEFAKGPIVKDYKAAGSWCDAHFPEAPPLTSDPVNAQLRRVGIGPGVYKAVVNYGNIASSFMLRVSPNRTLELYTSNHFPYCLSEHSNFKLQADGRSFEYDNHHHIHYTVELESSDQGMSIAFLYGPGDNFGFTIYKCEDCM